METIELTHTEIASAIQDGKTIIKCAKGTQYKVIIKDSLSFEITITDEFGKPVIQPIDICVTIDGAESIITTDSNGKAIVENPKSASNLELSFPQNTIEDLLKVLSEEWKNCPRVTGREEEIVKKSDDQTVTFLQNDLSDQKITVSTRRHTISIQQPVIMARMRGMYFDTSKCFMLPSAIPAVKSINDLYNDYTDSKLLIVGHTDKSGDISYNDKLSVERANAVAAYLTDNVDEWLKWYKDSVSWEKKWGPKEDQYMLDTVMAGEPLPANSNKTREFQKWHNSKLSNEPDAGTPLSEDGIIGLETRKALIYRYMKQDNTSLPEGIEIVIHGCGENFPLDSSEKELDKSSSSPDHDPTDRRVELFFFNNPVGILPEPPGLNSSKNDTQYPEWRSRSRVVNVGVTGQSTLRIQIVDELGNPAPVDTSYRITVGNSVREGVLSVPGMVLITGIVLDGIETAKVEWGESIYWKYEYPKEKTKK
jgi:outer membrane protein OmpA-like peptidoglycan-associated protein